MTTKFPCRHAGCPQSYIAPEYRDKHEQEPHQRCRRCGRHFVGLRRHQAHARTNPTCCKPKE